MKMLVLYLLLLASLLFSDAAISKKTSITWNKKSLWRKMPQQGRQNEIITNDIFPVLLGQNSDILTGKSPSSIIDVIQLSLKLPILANFSLMELYSRLNKSGAIHAFFLVACSEIGDKTFFIAALYAAKYGRYLAYTGSMFAVILMVGISTTLGQLLKSFPAFNDSSIPIQDVIAVITFAYFGMKSLYNSYQSDRQRLKNMERMTEKDEAIRVINTIDQQRLQSISAKLLQIFGLVFMAEIGDKSFLSNIALSSNYLAYPIMMGAIVAHSATTAIAVLFGELLSRYVSEELIGYCSGSIFVLFAVIKIFQLLRLQ